MGHFQINLSRINLLFVIKRKSSDNLLFIQSDKFISQFIDLNQDLWFVRYWSLLWIFITTERNQHYCAQGTKPKNSWVQYTTRPLENHTLLMWNSLSIIVLTSTNRCAQGVLFRFKNILDLIDKLEKFVDVKENEGDLPFRWKNGWT